MTRKEKDRLIYFTRSVYLIFALIWILLCIANKFYESAAAYVLFIPLIIFLMGFMNADCTCDNEVESDVFAVSFISIGILLSIPLLTLFNKNNDNILLNHVIFLAMISVLLSYYHIWVGYHQRHVCKAIRSCLETFSITLYIFAILIFFMSDTKIPKISEYKKATGGRILVGPDMLEDSNNYGEENNE